jgi:hypothetical protein
MGKSGHYTLGAGFDRSGDFARVKLRQFFLLSCPRWKIRMASQPRPGVPGTFRFEFDSANKILLLRFEGRLMDESLAEIHRAARIHWAATGARAGIGDYSSVTEFPLSAELVRTLARQGAPMPEPTENPHFIVMPSTTGYGLARMYQIVGELTQPLVSVVRTMDEALAALGVQSAHFEPLEQPQLM